MKKGFTLIELLIVIAILSVLGTAVILVLNPAQLLKQSRDSTRISDLAALHSAISLFLSDVETASFSSNTARCTVGTTSPMTASCSTNATTTVDGNGWVLIDFTTISSGSPLSRLPLDPVNNASFYYVFGQDTDETYEIDANMESTKYANTGGGDIESTDGGNNDDWYEIGNDPALTM